MKDRIDKVLVKIGLAPTRSQALLLIEEGVVYYKMEQITKASTLVTESDLEVRKDSRYVSRGGHKIEEAIKKFQIEIKDKIVADVGASTGGFTDYVLKNEAQKVYCIDVGHDQLALELRENKKVINYEGVNIKHSFTLPELVDLAVVDLSFISLKLVLKNIFSLVKASGEIVALVKPQFEVGKDGIDKNGIVKSEGHRLVMLFELKKWCENENFKILGQIDSPILGKDGNKEYFFYFKKDS